jgi:hypothetical protein
VIPAHVEVLGPHVVSRYTSVVTFERGTKVREIGTDAFFNCAFLRTFTVPSSVEILGDRCLRECFELETIVFQGLSKLKRIGERAFMNCDLASFTIPASTEEIDGSAFIGCPIVDMRVAEGNQNFVIQRNLLLTLDGSGIVRYFGREVEVIVPKNVLELRKSCFECLNQLERVVFEEGSKLRKIGRSALAESKSLTGITIPASVEIIDERAFEGCDGLEVCVIDECSSLVRIGKWAFAECCSLRSFDIPQTVDEIGASCFEGCAPLDRLRFGSGDRLKKFVGDFALDEWLENIGFSDISSVFRLEIDDCGTGLEFRGWFLVDDETSHLALVRDV